MTTTFRTLGVGIDADAAEIKRAWRRLARRFHPDVSDEPDAEARFKAVRDAYAQLRDPGVRKTLREAERERRRLRAEEAARVLQRIRREAALAPRTRHVVVAELRRGIPEPLCDVCGAPARTRATCACAWPDGDA